MATHTLTCTCGSRLLIHVPFRAGIRATLLTKGYAAGWRMRDGAWFCSEDCLLTTARDVTPAAPQTLQPYQAEFLAQLERQGDDVRVTIRDPRSAKERV